MYISTQEELSQFIAEISHERAIAVDTEFLREKTYFPKLCLIQVGTKDKTAAIDPLVITDLHELSELLTNDEIVKVFHACGQDLEVLSSALGVAVSPVFDTQLAAAFLGHRMQLGYGALVEAVCGVHLPKAGSLTDWSVRPLTPEQLSYAEDDVRYLIEIYDRFMGELIQKNRLSWLDPELLALTQSALGNYKPEDMVFHLKRVGVLSKRQLGIAKEVCIWREQTAQKRNIPRRWVLSDEAILEIAKMAPRSFQLLRRIRGTENLFDGDVAKILYAVKLGLSCPEENLPILEHKRGPSAEEESVLDLMYALARRVSEKSGVATQLIATRDDLHEFYTNRKSSRLNEGWRFELLGSQLDRLLTGELGLTVKDGRIELL